MFSWDIFVLTFLVMLMWKTRKFLNYYVKFFIFTVYVLSMSLVLLPMYCCFPRNPINFLYASPFYRPVARLIGLKFTVIGRENLDSDQSCVIVANHQTSLDVIGMFEIWNSVKKGTMIAKRELMFAGPFGIAIWLGGIVFIDRFNGDKGKSQINNALDKLKKSNTKLWVFAEGTRRNTGEIHSFKKGAFHAAVHAQLPVVPVVYSSYKNIVDSKKRKFHRGEVIMKVLPAIPTEGLTAADVDELVEKTRAKMIVAYNEISGI